MMIGDHLLMNKLGKEKMWTRDQFEALENGFKDVELEEVNMDKTQGRNLPNS
jgi:hypothetical protein